MTLVRAVRRLCAAFVPIVAAVSFANAQSAPPRPAVDPAVLEDIAGRAASWRTSACSTGSGT